MAATQTSSAADEQTTRSARGLLGAAFDLCAGLAIAWVDSRPGWDDTGITVGALLIATLLAGIARVPPWLAVLLTAGPLLAVELPRGTGVLLALPVALAGAYGGAWLRKQSTGT